MNRHLQNAAVRSTLVFFAVTLSLSIGIGLLVAAMTQGWLQFDVPDTLALVILFSPTIAAIVLTITTNGWNGLHDLFAPLTTWRVPLHWYLAALFLPAVLNLSSIGLYVLLGGSSPSIPGAIPSDLEPLTTGSIARTALFLSLYFLTASLAEEVGWRGYALPRLQSHLTALSSSLIIGVIWTVWHVPSFFLLPGSAQAAIPFLWYIPSVLAISVVFTWLYNNTRGSLLLATLLHASIQATNILLPNLPADRGDTQLYGMNVIVVIVVAAIILTISGHRNLSRSQPKVVK